MSTMQNDAVYVELQPRNNVRWYHRMIPLISTVAICVVSISAIVCLILILNILSENDKGDASTAATARPTAEPSTTPTTGPTANPTIWIPYEYSVSLAHRMCQFCLIAYCVDHGQKDVESWTCNACTTYFPGLPNNVTTLYTNFLNYDINLYVAYDNAYIESIVIAFAGTDPISVTDWIDDIEFFQMQYPLAAGTSAINCTDCYVHQGFWESYNKIRTDLWKIVEKYRSAFGAHIPIQITGHSLGGALAAHCALDFKLNYDIEPQLVYTYGQPRIGNKQFALFYRTMIGVHYRVTYSHDPVPHLPLEDMGESETFWHVATEVFYETHPNGTYKVCDGTGEDESCANKFSVVDDLVLHIPDHLRYMGYDIASDLVRCRNI